MDRLDIHSKQFTEIIQTIADKHDIKFEVAKKIVMSQFECVRANMKKADGYNNFFPYIKLPHLMTFKINPKRRQLYVEKAKKIVADVYLNEQQSND